MEPDTCLLGATLQATAQAKCELEDEVRVVHLASHMGYAELLQSARAKFPRAPPFVIKYLDRCDHLWLARSPAHACSAPWWHSCRRWSYDADRM